MWTRPIAVAETDTFIRQATAIWTDKERLAFVDFIARNPEAGDIIPETGGVRKVRWLRQGSGKRGGTRVIYFYYHPEAPLYLLSIYAKARKENLTPDEKKAVRAFTTALKRKYPAAGKRTT
jgi:hypothetical protein